MPWLKCLGSKPLVSGLNTRAANHKIRPLQSREEAEVLTESGDGTTTVLNHPKCLEESSSHKEWLEETGRASCHEAAIP